jgi:hypothetical protein
MQYTSPSPPPPNCPAHKYSAASRVPDYGDTAATTPDTGGRYSVPFRGRGFVVLAPLHRLVIGRGLASRRARKRR